MAKEKDKKEERGETTTNFFTKKGRGRVGRGKRQEPRSLVFYTYNRGFRQKGEKIGSGEGI